MEVRFAHLCDYALVSKEGKLSVLGIFSNIVVRNLPATHPSAYLAFELEFNHAEMNQPVPLRIELVDADGAKLLRLEAEVVAEGPQQIGARPRLAQILTLNQLTFRKSGSYEFNFFISEALKHQLPFSVNVIAGDSTLEIGGQDPPPVLPPGA
ncbi:hypothetical protein BH23GEM2_BH23GEM2_14810 [soil metagenome]